MHRVQFMRQDRPKYMIRMIGPRLRKNNVQLILECVDIVVHYSEH